MDLTTQPSQSVPMVWPAADCDSMCLGVIVTLLTAGGLTLLSLFFFTNQYTTYQLETVIFFLQILDNEIHRLKQTKTSKSIIIWISRVLCSD